MNVQGLGVYPANAPREFTSARPAVQITIAELGGGRYVHLVLDGVAIMLDENHATALARILDGAVAEVQARAVSR